MLCQLFRVSALQLPIRRSLGRRTITLGATYLRSTRKTWSPQVEMYVRKMVQRYDNLCQKMTSVQDMDQSELKDTSKSMNELAPVKQLYERLLSKRRELLDLSSTVIDDEEFGELLKEEIQDYRSQIHALQQQLVEELSPTDADDKNSAVLEVRAGTGGKEASLFAAEIYAMYQKFAHSRKWKVEVLSESYSETGGLKDASASITGENVFGWLKHEVGVHRVQRVPITEAQGRIHTSTITVAVLPQPYDVISDFLSPIVLMNHVNIYCDIPKVLKPRESESDEKIWQLSSVCETCFGFISIHHQLLNFTEMCQENILI